MIHSRRRFLVGVGGAVVALPFLEGLAPRRARADDLSPSFALFYRRGNGVQQAMFARVENAEPERWWPQIPYGPIDSSTLAGLSECALSPLSDYASRLTIVRGLRHPVGTQLGHREGWIQGLTGAGVKYPGDRPDAFACDPLGESLDNRIARELTSEATEPLYLGHGMHDNGGVSYLRERNSTGTQITRAAEDDLVAVYARLFPASVTQSLEAQRLLLLRRQSVNDFVREDIQRLKGDPRLSAADLARLDLHLTAIREVEQVLAPTIPSELRGEIATYQNQSDHDRDWWRGGTVAQAGDVMGKLAALAIACGKTRAVVINMGSPQDTTTYAQVEGASVADFHSISHRQRIDRDPTSNIADAQILHHRVDVFHVGLFRGILDQLKSRDMGDSTTLLDRGVCVHYSDLGSGQHEMTHLPYLYVGNAGGKLKTGLYENHEGAYVVNLLNTLGAAVGLKNADGRPLDDFNADNNGGLRGRLDSLVGA